MAYDYTVVPFRAHGKGTITADEIARQLSAAIAQHATDGFELHEVATVTVEVAPGCLGGILGQKAQMLSYEQLVFKREQT